MSEKLGRPFVAFRICDTPSSMLSFATEQEGIDYLTSRTPPGEEWLLLDVIGRTKQPSVETKFARSEKP